MVQFDSQHIILLFLHLAHHKFVDYYALEEINRGCPLSTLPILHNIRTCVGCFFS